MFVPPRLSFVSLTQVQLGRSDGGEGGGDKALEQGRPDLRPDWLHRRALGGGREDASCSGKERFLCHVLLQVLWKFSPVLN